MRKTDQQINEEVKKLREMKPYIRQYSFFGDDNHESIEVQIQVLEGRMDEDEIYETWPEPEDEEDGYEYIRSNAMDALNWAMGTEEDDSSLSADWAHLDRRNSEKIQ